MELDEYGISCGGLSAQGGWDKAMGLLDLEELWSWGKGLIGSKGSWAWLGGTVCHVWIQTSALCAVALMKWSKENAVGGPVKMGLRLSYHVIGFDSGTSTNVLGVSFVADRGKSPRQQLRISIFTRASIPFLGCPRSCFAQMDLYEDAMASYKPRDLFSCQTPRLEKQCWKRREL